MMFERFVEEGGVGLSLERKAWLVYLRCVAEVEDVSRIVLELSWRQVRGETSSSACPTCEGWTPQGRLQRRTYSSLPRAEWPRDGWWIPRPQAGAGQQHPQMAATIGRTKLGPTR